MKLGYFTMPLHPPGSEWSYTLQKDLQQILLLDELSDRGDDVIGIA